MTKPLVLTLVACLAAIPAFCDAPAIAAQGVKNAASYEDPELPNGPIAEGSIFNIFGSSMGPAALAYATSLPLPINLSGTSINVTVGGTTVQCFMIYTSAGQVAAILPSNTPAGTGTITVSYNGTVSPPMPITVAKSSFGIFALNQQGSGTGVIQDGNYNFNSPTFAFQPGETVVLWGTGLGPITGSDATTPPTGNLPGINVSVTVGGAPAAVTYAGRSGYSGDDQVAFTIPSGISGCAVPVAVTVSGTNGASPVVSNFVTLSVGTGATCTDSEIPASLLQLFTSGNPVRTGSVLLVRNTNLNTAVTSDAGSASFNKYTPNNFFNGETDFIYGACIVISTPAAGGVAPTGLDAGAAINVNGPNGAKPIAAEAGSPGDYIASFARTAPLYLDPGSYALNNGSGGADVGPFNFNITVPAAFTWTNNGQIASVPRSQPLTVTWSGGDPNADVFVLGSSSVADGAVAIFECRTQASAGTFTVPAAILQALPASASSSPTPANPNGTPLGTLGLLSSSTHVIPNPTGLDYLSANDEQESTKTGIPYQ